MAKTSSSGETYVVFDKDTQNGQTFALNGSNEFNLSALTSDSADGSNGFVVNGIEDSDWSGYSVSVAGDVNGDGIADLIIGAPAADSTAMITGETYVVFGKDTENGQTFALNDSYNLTFPV